MSSWYVEEVNENSLTMMLLFSLPEAVSYNRNDRDKIKFSILKRELFIGVGSLKSISENEKSNSFEFYIPEQLPLDQV